MLTQWIREFTLRMWLIHGCVAAALGVAVTIIYFLAKLVTRTKAIVTKIDALSGVTADIVADTESLTSHAPNTFTDKPKFGGTINGKS